MNPSSSAYSPVRLFSLLCILLSTLVSSQTASAQDVWDGSVASSYDSGDGSQASPYVIKSPAQLALLAQTVNSGYDDSEGFYSGVYFRLDDDIYLNDPADVYAESPSALQWTPIGQNVTLGLEQTMSNATVSFRGHFDGNGHTVYGLFIENTSFDNQALFGVTCNSAVIENLNVADSYVKCRYQAAGIVANANGKTSNVTTISNCSFNGQVVAIARAGGICAEAEARVSNCVNYGVVMQVHTSTSDTSVGGISARVWGSGNYISNCANYGSVSSTSNVAGGIVAHVVSEAVCSGCVNYGQVSSVGSAGGICGEPNSLWTVSQCINLGTVYADEYSGGIVGLCHDNGSISGGSSLLSCVNYGTISGGSYVGGIVGYLDHNGKGVKLQSNLNVGSVSGDEFVSYIAGASSTTSASYLSNNVYDRTFLSDSYAAIGSSDYDSRAYGAYTHQITSGSLFASGYYQPQYSYPVPTAVSSSSNAAIWSDMVKVYSSAVTLDGEEDPQSVVSDFFAYGDYGVTWSSTRHVSVSAPNVSILEPGVATLECSLGDVSLSRQFIIRNLNYGSLVLEYSEVDYDGSPMEPEVSVVLGGKVVDPSYYILEFDNNDEIGTASARVSGNGTFSGSLQSDFLIKSYGDYLVSVVLAETIFTYDGSAKEPELQSLSLRSFADGSIYELSGTQLQEAIDDGYLVVSYSNNVATGSPRVSVVGDKIHYQSSTQTYFVIIDNPDIQLSIDPVEVVYTGCPISVDEQVTVSVTKYRQKVDKNGKYWGKPQSDGSETYVLPKDKDYYSVSYPDGNTDAGTVTLRVDCVGELNEEVSDGGADSPQLNYVTIVRQSIDGLFAEKSFTIIPADISSESDVEQIFSFADIASRVYTGKEITLQAADFNISYRFSDDVDCDPVLLQLGADKDFVITGYSNNVNVGTATVHIKGVNNFKGERDLTFKIGAACIATMTPSTAGIDDAYEYVGTPITPDFSLFVNFNGTNELLTQGVDYSVSFAENRIDVADSPVSVTVRGKGGYDDSDACAYTFSFAILPDTVIATIADVDVVYGDSPSFSYELSESISLSTDVLLASPSADEAAANNPDSYWTPVGSYAIVGSDGVAPNYEILYVNGTLSVSARDISDPAVIVDPIPDFSRTGSEATPSVSVSCLGVSLVLGVDFTVSYSNNVVPGQADVVITGLGNFSGVRTEHFVISGHLYDWLGNTDSDWYTASNWAGGSVPDADADVYIADGCAFYPVLDDSQPVAAQSRSIYLQGSDASSVLTLEPGARLVVADAIYVSHHSGSHLVINHRYDNMSSLVAPSIVDDDGNEYCNVTVNRTLLSLVGYYLGSCTKQGTISSGFDMAFCAPYDPTSSSYDMSMSGPNDFSSSYVNGFSLGIVSLSDDESTFSQVGSLLNSSSVAPDVELQHVTDSVYGFNLLSNPYPFTIPLRSDFFSIPSDADPVIWFPSYDASSQSNGFKTVNLALGVAVSSLYSAGDDQLLLPAGQGFFLRKNSDAANQLFHVDGRSVSASDVASQNVALKSGTVESDVLRLTLSSKGCNADEVAIVFRSGGSESLVYGDAVKMSLSSDDNSIAVRKDGQLVSIPFYPEVSNLSSRILPLSVRLAQGVSRGSINATNIDFFSAADDVYLVDYLKNVKVNFRQVSCYDFSVDANKSLSLNDRFAIELSAGGRLTPSAAMPVSATVLISPADGNAAMVSASTDVWSSGCAVVSVYDVAGRRLSSSTLKSERTLVPLGESMSVYIVEVRYGNDVVRSKLF